MRRRTLILPVFVGLGILGAVLVRNSREKAAPPADVAAPKHLDAFAPSRLAPPGPTLPGSAATANAPSDDDIIANTDPSSKKYDPVTLNRVMNTRPSELLSKEPRDAAFADAREAVLRDRIVDRLRKRITYDADVNVNCRTSSCEVTIQGKNNGDDLNAALQAIDVSRLAEAVEIGPMTRHGDSQQKGMSIVMLYSINLRDPHAYDRLLRQHEAHDELPSNAANTP